MKYDTDQSHDDTIDSFDPAMMLFIAGELDAQGMRTFEASLSIDPARQKETAALVATDTLLRSDAAARVVSAAQSRQALTQSIRLVREQALLLGERPAVAARGRHLVNLPRWAWGSAVAAVLAVGFVVWVSNSDPTAPTVATVATNLPAHNGGGEGETLGSAFGPIQPDFSDDVAGDIDDQVDALQLLATMTDQN